MSFRGTNYQREVQKNKRLVDKNTIKVDTLRAWCGQK